MPLIAKPGDIPDLIFRYGLALAIEVKWLLDGLRLPLSPGQRALYGTIHRLCWHQLGQFPNLVDCRDYNDKIQWLKLFDQMPETVRCSDKLGARDYVRERIGDGFLPDLYQVREHFRQIDFRSLPNSFVIKTNHDSGTVILVRNKASIDMAACEARIEQALASTYGRETGEWAYASIQPKVFVEELIESGGESPPPDYKFHCVDGKMRWLQYIYDRGASTKEVIVDCGGRRTEIHFDHNMQCSNDFAVPENWLELRTVAEALAEGFRYVRVDLYSTQRRIYVGELTFFPLMGCYKGEGQRQLGRLLDFDRTSPRQPIGAPESDGTGQ